MYMTVGDISDITNKHRDSVLRWCRKVSYLVIDKIKNASHSNPAKFNMDEVCSIISKSKIRPSIMFLIKRDILLFFKNDNGFFERDILSLIEEQNNFILSIMTKNEVKSIEYESSHMCTEADQMVLNILNSFVDIGLRDFYKVIDLYESYLSKNEKEKKIMFRNLSFLGFRFGEGFIDIAVKFEEIEKKLYVGKGYEKKIKESSFMVMDAPRTQRFCGIPRGCVRIDLSEVLK